jgi:hypothetical protein
LQRPHFATDLAAFIPHLTTKGEDIAGDDPTGMHDNVAIDRYQVASKRTVDVRVTVHDQKVALEVLRRAETKVALVSPPSRNCEAAGAVLPLQRRAEPRLDLGRATEIAEIDRSSAPGNSLRTDPRPVRLALRMNSGGDVGDEGPDLTDEIGWRVSEPRIGGQRPLRHNGEAAENQE